MRGRNKIRGVFIFVEGKESQDDSLKIISAKTHQTFRQQDTGQKVVEYMVRKNELVHLLYSIRYNCNILVI